MVLKIIIGAVVVFLAVWAWKIRIYLKWQKRAKANVAPFYRFPERIHQLPAQKEKLRQAKEESFIVHFQDEEKGLARIKQNPIRKKSGVIWECASVQHTRRITVLVNIYIKLP